MKKACFVFAAAVLALALTGCPSANGTDGGSAGGGSSAGEIFKSPQSVLKNIDVDLVPSASRSAARSVGEVTTTGTVLTTTSAGGFDVDAAQDGMVSYHELSGEAAQTRMILSLLKNEIAAKQAVAQSGFDQVLTNLGQIGQFTETAKIFDTDKFPGDQMPMTVGAQMDIKKFEVRLVSDTVADIYFTTAVDMENYSGTFDIIVECTQNSSGTLDTELYIDSSVAFGQNPAMPMQLYDKFTLVQGKRVRVLKNVGGDGSSSVVQMTLDSDGNISGFGKRTTNQGTAMDVLYYFDSAYGAAKQGDALLFVTRYGEKIYAEQNGAAQYWLSFLKPKDGATWTLKRKAENSEEYELTTGTGTDAKTVSVSYIDDAYRTPDGTTNAMDYFDLTVPQATLDDIKEKVNAITATTVNASNDELVEKLAAWKSENSIE